MKTFILFSSKILNLLYDTLHLATSGLAALPAFNHLEFLLWRNEAVSSGYCKNCVKI